MKPEMQSIELEDFLLQELRFRLKIEAKYSDQLIRLNLPFFFVHDNNSAINWVEFIEDHFNIDIPDHEVDYFFFSNFSQMAYIINKNCS